MGDLWGILLAAFLILVNAFFVAVEFALISSRKDRLDSMIASGNQRAKKVRYAVEHLTIMLAGAQFGITIASVLLGMVGEPAIAHLIEAPLAALGLPESFVHPIGFTIALLLITMLHIVLGEMVPKNIALAGPETVGTYLVLPHLAFVKVTHPIMVVLNWIARTVLHAFGVEQKDELDSTVSPHELANMIAESRSEGLMAADEADRISNALASSRRAMGEVLIPREDVYALPFGTSGPTVMEVHHAVVETGFSRFPVADSNGTWLGYVHVKDALDDFLADRDVAVPIRPLITVTSTQNFDLAMRAMRVNSSHVAAVVENGRTIGLVMLEDIIEELVGTVRDWTHD